MRETALAKLNEFKACCEALHWISKTEGNLQDLWRVCPRPEWMLWLIRKINESHTDEARKDYVYKQIILCDCEMIRDVVQYFDEVSMKLCMLLVDSLEKWCKNSTDESGIDLSNLRYKLYNERNSLYYIIHDVLGGVVTGSNKYTINKVSFNTVSICNSPLACACTFATAKVGASAAYAPIRDAKLAQYSDTVRKYFPDCPLL